VVAFMKFIAREMRELMASLGFRTVNEMVGHSECIDMKAAVGHWKARNLDFSKILHQPGVGSGVGTYCQIKQDHGLERALDNTTLLELCAPALEKGSPVQASMSIRNIHRAVGTILGSELTRRFGPEGLPDDTIQLRFKGSAGQSFGAFVPRGITMTLEGDSNDYVGKGLSGGKIVVFPPSRSTFAPEENVVIGNVAFYGATSGEAYIYGVAGERFCVRNSGVNAVVEAVGDHGCEYMTGGRVIVLGRTGRNFAAGMSGGIAYVLDQTGDFPGNCNREMVELTSIDDPEEIDVVKTLLFRHSQYTGSKRATNALLFWDDWITRFVRIIPKDYKRVLDTQREKRESGLGIEEAAMAAFELNSHDAARLGGK
ncbi:MAG TPA: glutamate synthase subunit alpha, partial [Blastocatellia bacterium]|nr:glutamate synthase subunit alpha [Blastocatellia bacterium]